MDLLEVSITYHVREGSYWLVATHIFLLSPPRGREVRAAFDLKVEATRHVVCILILISIFTSWVMVNRFRSPVACCYEIDG